VILADLDDLEMVRAKGQKQDDRDRDSDKPEQD
jgi:hypothetical protein